MATTKKNSKKTIRLELIKRLEEAFSDLKKPLGSTKFKRNIKKAGKALAADLKPLSASPKKSKANTSKKASVKEKLPDAIPQ